MKVILVLSEINTQYARLVHQEAAVFMSEKMAHTFMEKMYDNINQEFDYLTHGSIGARDAELVSARTYQTFFWRIIPAI